MKFLLIHVDMEMLRFALHKRTSLFELDGYAGGGAKWVKLA